MSDPKLSEGERRFQEALDEALKLDGIPPPARLNLPSSVPVVTWEKFALAYESRNPPGGLDAEEYLAERQGIAKDLIVRGIIDGRKVGDIYYVWKNGRNGAEASASNGHEHDDADAHSARLNGGRDPQAGIPFVMTATIKQALRDRGYTDEEISELKPGEAHQLLDPPSAPDLTARKSKSRDMNDALRSGGPEAVREMSDAAKPVEPQRNAAKNAQAPIIKTAALLQGVTFAPLKYIVPGLIVEGLIILAGKPKARKSFFALDIALAIAAGRFCLGDRKPETGDALYLALEDGERRLQQRMTKLLGGKWPDRFHYAIQWPRADQGGVGAIDAWCETHPEARMVVIDVFARFRVPTTNKQNAYEQDYHALAKLQELSTRRRITILVVHHTRKGVSDDPVEEISGTLGLAGAADGFLILKRTALGATLTGRCRDTDDVDLALQFSAETCRWTILGEAQDVQRSEHKGRVMVALEEAGATGLTPGEIAAEVEGLKHENAKQLLRRMAKASEVQSKQGRYFHNTVVLSIIPVTVSPDPVTGAGVCKNPSKPPYSPAGNGDSDTVTAITAVSPPDHTPALEFLTWALTPGPRLVRDIEASARAEGLLGEHQRIDHAKSIQTAKRILGVVVEREGFGPGSKVYWRLPDHPERKAGGD